MKKEPGRFEGAISSERVVQEAVPERAETLDAASAERVQAIEARDSEAVEIVRTELVELSSTALSSQFHADLYGAFASERADGGKIVLEGEAARSAEHLATTFRHEAKMFSDLVAGERIAAAYDTRTNNFRAQTRLAALPDGRQVFMIYDHHGSWRHRLMDSLMKRLNGLPMRKAGRGEWKRRHEERTAIPVIENADPHMAMMPYVPNANAKDVFANNAEIEDFGTCAWAKEAGLEEKIALAQRIMDEVKHFHDTRGPWGEAVLSNVILTEQKDPVLCDFEVKYQESVPLVEAKARDVKDMCMSVGAALEAAHGQDVTKTVRTLLDRYADAGVIAELKKLATQKRGILGNIFFGYEQARTGTKSKKQYDAIRAAIAAYEPATAS